MAKIIDCSYCGKSYFDTDDHTCDPDKKTLECSLCEKYGIILNKETLAAINGDMSDSKRYSSYKKMMADILKENDNEKTL